MFTEQDRDRVYEEVLTWARSDPRVVAAAVVGSLATRPGDRWSDLDLTFGISDEASIPERVEHLVGAPRANVRRGGLVRPPERRSHLPGVPASWVPAGGSFVRPGLAVRSDRSRLSAVVWKRDVEAPRRAAVGARPLRLRRAPRGSSANLHRARPVVAGRVLDQRPSRQRHEPGVPATRPARRPTDEASTIFPPSSAHMRKRALVRALEPETLAKALQRGVELLLNESGEAGDLPSHVEARLRAFTKRQAPM